MYDDCWVTVLDDRGNPYTTTLSRAIQKLRQDTLAYERSLGIKRPYVPVMFNMLPETPDSLASIRLANSIRAAARLEYFAPETFEQGVWLRCVQLYWEAKGIAIANSIYPVTPKQQLDQVLQQIIPATAFENLQLEVAAHLSWYNLLKEGETEIKVWAKKIESDPDKPVWAKAVVYNFETVEQLFIETLRNEFEILLSHSVLSTDQDIWSRKIERDQYRQWLKFFADYFCREPEEKQYIQFLQSMGWRGYAVLALQDKKYKKPLKYLWQQHIKTLRPLVKFLDTRVYWQNGKPYQSVRINGKRVKRQQQIKTEITGDGYFLFI